MSKLLIVQCCRTTAVLLLVLSAGCSSLKEDDPAVPSTHEIAMPPNATLTATTDAGTITIQSGNGLKRYYTWDGSTRFVVMKPRIERWFGSFGINFVAEGNHWAPVNGITRGVLEEGQQNFDTLEAAQEWLNKNCNHCVYNDSGLVVSFFKSPGREQINVSVWQIHVGGKTPSPYRESTWRQRFPTLNMSKEAKERESRYEARYDRAYYTDGEKPAKLAGSNNSAIITSWDQ